MLLNEFDENKISLINPTDIIDRIEDFPEVVVSCFSYVTFQKLLNSHSHYQVATVSFANLVIPVYVMDYEGKNIGMFNAYVSSAGCVAAIEELIAMGMKQLILFGTCGVLDKSIKQNTVIIPTRALRDEGTSFHYLKSSTEVVVNKQHELPFQQLLDILGISHISGKVWTTDAFYRETKSKMSKRKEAGCICVDMECSAVSAVCQFREIELLHFFYTADNLDAESWDERSLSNHSHIEKKHSIADAALKYAIIMSNNIEINE